MLTVNEIKDQIQKVIDEHPDNVNPVQNSVCLYTDTADPDWHCIVGQWLADNGHHVPGPSVLGGIRSILNGEHSDSVLVNKIKETVDVTTDGLRFLSKVQQVADGFHTGYPIVWSEIDLDDVLVSFRI